ncbi:PD-(D/E)XK nuclease family protein [Puia dinghuensis]|uniref:PD-(D/E)XK endonuclease-like domain-containing protein n=1 Tax=Puia dinghuensis TaxID=1792502 RepID=A0A8J2UB55_9BACT|nr:PD-(D/E)XK nuclease family protein [Puia dinghuensis]GGA92396.1 hypothetical protein GCM10011511_14740 [Puia dinghuensis]
MQTDLFGNIIPMNVEPETQGWSHSRANALESCPRKYFYAYYGSKKRAARNLENKTHLEFLAKMGNRPLIMGTIIHETIDYYFRRYKAGSNHSLNQLLSHAFTKLEDAFALTLKMQAAIKPIELKPDQKLFKEVYYGRIGNISEFKEGIKQKIQLNLTNFYTSEDFEFLRRGGKMKGSMQESWVRLSILDFAKVVGKLDLCFEDYDQNFIVSDWKTGNLENEETSLQLMIYALWAVEARKIDKSRVKLYKAYLQEGTVEDLEFSDDHIMRAKMKVVQDSERMKYLHKYGIDGNEAAFTKLPVRGKICEQCPFEEVCYKLN